MEKRIKGFVTERLDNNDTISFKIRASEETAYNVTNCHSVPTDLNAMEKGVACYSGNVELSDNDVIKNVTARIWIHPDNNCVLVYNDC